jgi:hypothetical protein
MFCVMSENLNKGKFESMEYLQNLDDSKDKEKEKSKAKVKTL